MMELGWYSCSQAPEVSVGDDPLAAWAVRPGGRRAARGEGSSEKAGKTGWLAVKGASCGPREGVKDS